MKKLKVIIGITFLLILVVILVLVISNCFHLKNTTEPKVIKSLSLAEKFDLENI